MMSLNTQLGRDAYDQLSVTKLSEIVAFFPLAFKVSILAQT